MDYSVGSSYISGIIVRNCLLTQYYWDMLLFIPTDVRYFRFATWSPLKAVVNRFSTWGLAVSTYVMIFALLDRNTCMAMFGLAGCFNGLSVTSAFIIINARIWALYQYEKKVNYGLATLTSLLGGTVLALAATTIYMIQKWGQYPDGESICTFDLDIIAVGINQTSAELQFIYVSVALFMTMYKILRRHRNKPGSLTLHQLMALQGGYHFSVLVVVHLAGVTVAHLPGSLQWTMVAPATIWTSMIISRIVYQQFEFNFTQRRNSNLLMGYTGLLSALGSLKSSVQFINQDEESPEDEPESPVNSEGIRKFRFPRSRKSSKTTVDTKGTLEASESQINGFELQEVGSQSVGIGNSPRMRPR